jgi:hypothetical protein
MLKPVANQNAKSNGTQDRTKAATDAQCASFILLPVTAEQRGGIMSLQNICTGLTRCKPFRPQPGRPKGAPLATWIGLHCK